jgi:hypothetical protein
MKSVITWSAEKYCSVKPVDIRWHDRQNEGYFMKILSIVSSYRMDGNTGRTVSLIEEQLQKEAAQRHVSLEIERISLGRLDVRTCRGCRLCFDRGEDMCPIAPISKLGLGQSGAETAGEHCHHKAAGKQIAK